VVGGASQLGRAVLRVAGPVAAGPVPRHPGDGSARPAISKVSGKPKTRSKSSRFRRSPHSSRSMSPTACTTSRTRPASSFTPIASTFPVWLLSRPSAILSRAISFSTRSRLEGASEANGSNESFGLPRR